MALPGVLRRSLSSNDGNGNGTKTSLDNKRFGNGDYFSLIASSSHPLLMTGQAARGLVEALLK